MNSGSQVMPSSMTYQPQDVVARIAYWPEGKAGSLAAEERVLNIAYRDRAVDSREMTICDSRNIGGDLTLDKNGFQVLILPGVPRYTKDDKVIETEQYPEIIEALKNITGGSYVRIFSHIVRDQLDARQESDKLGEKANGSSTDSRSPAIRPHVDFHAGTCPSFFSGGRADLARYIASGKRWQVIGVWRPLKTVQRNPLALCDARTVAEADFEKVERDFKGRPGAYCVLKPGDGNRATHRWYYLPEQRPDEAWVFKHFDSLQENGNARQCAHTSLELPGTRNLPPRESVEFRVLVLY